MSFITIAIDELEKLLSESEKNPEKNPRIENSRDQ